ncbi:HET-domain-containing protein [Hyaloscypha variabilis F]|uniref:HET-domain-containing protein n=1 Tax=Hyaloscypha variabilis (strain UAMH 11265 / GT02V1 / F) TaxID=1149755 RepID=A0A2J6R3M0_HYAVF|nr:HET-domain-containing protein [Hyaloscypha variabilis F]
MDVMNALVPATCSDTLIYRASDLSEQCSVCQSIADAFLAKDGLPESAISLGTWQGYLDRKGCACCQLVVSCLSKCKPCYIAFEPSCPLRLGKMIHTFWLGSDYFIDDHVYSPYRASKHPFIELIPKHVSGQNFPGYLPVHPARINITRLRMWPKWCTQNHQGSCHSLPHWQVIPPASSMILIDVYDYCLVHFPNQISHQYVALSYVWGQLSGTIELRKTNFSQLCLKNSLKLPNNMLCIPRTILDAIALTRAMDLRYLWVDRLCIIQDEPTHLTQQLQQMASIYANSYFTIIATDGADADYGLPGVASNTSPRTYKETLFRFTENFNMIEKPRVEERDEAFWHTRAWTFQERALSPRNLVFVRNTVYWQCRHAVWFENVSAEPDGITSEVPTSSLNENLVGEPYYALKTKPWPDITQYFELIRGYNNRNLTFESDTLRAFSAVTTAMAKSFPGGFHFGLPMFLFDLGMLWSIHGRHSRRVSFPSWSWLGWTGDVSLHSGYAKFWKPNFGYYDGKAELSPLVDWYAIHGDGSYHLIDNSYHQHQADISNSSFQLPDGWTKTWNIYHDTEAVEHESLPHHSFRHPFPIFPVDGEDKSHSFSQYLKFEAQSCTLFLDTTNDRTSVPHTDLVMVDLLDMEGLWAGVIESINVIGNEYKSGAACELVAISRGSRMKDHFDRVFKETDTVPAVFKEMDTVPALKKLEKYSFYNVLWVEWFDSIAYRRGIGRVFTEAWDRQSIKTVSVVLG